MHVSDHGCFVADSASSVPVSDILMPLSIWTWDLIVVFGKEKQWALCLQYNGIKVRTIM